MSTADDPSSSYEGPSAAHRLSFSSKKEKRRTIIIQCSNQSEKHAKFMKNELETLHRR